jgi:hypothetical protein|eukprot:SAG25_NODE_158_length_13455_cov_15.344714_18_plen_73_part_00
MTQVSDDARGSEVAHIIYLEETFGPVFARFWAHIMCHWRYIDDGFLLFSGATAKLATLPSVFGSLSVVSFDT